MLEIVDEIRGFNRFYTRVLGLLRPDLAGSAFGLTEARVMFELTHGEHVSPSDLRRELDSTPVTSAASWARSPQPVWSSVNGREATDVVKSSG